MLQRYKGKLKNKINIKNIIKSMMPGGSVIGCPKIKHFRAFK